jgi:hypothetical protein
MNRLYFIATLLNTLEIAQYIYNAFFVRENDEARNERDLLSL